MPGLLSKDVTSPGAQRLPGRRLNAVRIGDGLQGEQNLSEEPGGGIFPQRRATDHRRPHRHLPTIELRCEYANAAQDQVRDSFIAPPVRLRRCVGSTGDILVVRSRVDGNTTDGDGGAIYADEDVDVTGSTRRSTADAAAPTRIDRLGDVTSAMPRSRISRMRSAVIPRSRCQANSSSPGQ